MTTAEHDKTETGFDTDCKETQTDSENIVNEDIENGAGSTEDKNESDSTVETTDLAAEWEARCKRLQADFDNFRKRTQGEKEQLSLYIKAQLFEDILPVLDNFERALTAPNTQENQAFLEGFAMIHQNLEAYLKKNGLALIDAKGKEFDPNFHQAVLHGPSEELPDNTVSDVLQKGYTVEGKVIRPAMVKVVNNG